MKYLVAWEVLETGRIERGNLFYTSLHEAGEIARMLNDAWPEFRHWVEPLAQQAPGKTNGGSSRNLNRTFISAEHAGGTVLAEP